MALMDRSVTSENKLFGRVGVSLTVTFCVMMAAFQPLPSFVLFGLMWAGVRSDLLALGLALATFGATFCLMTVCRNRSIGRPLIQFSLIELFAAMALTSPLMILGVIRFEVLQTSAPPTWYAGFPLPYEFSNVPGFWLPGLCINGVVLAIHFFCMLFLVSEPYSGEGRQSINSDDK